MKNPVIIKGNRYGLVLILDPNSTMGEIIDDLEHKLSGDFKLFKSQTISVAFEGKILTNDEVDLIIQIFRKNGLNVSYIIDDNYTPKIPNTINPKSNDGLFYRGNLKCGQIIDARESIIILGDIETGAEVYSEGNIIIIGKLFGQAFSGTKGKDNTFVVVYEDEGGLQYV